MSRIISAAHISRVLAKRETRFTSTATRVRGWRATKAGFKVSTTTVWDPTTVFVTYQPELSSSALLDNLAESTQTRQARLERYAEVLREAGYVAEVEVDEQRRVYRVVVTKPAL